MTWLRKREDWRETNEEAWRTTSKAGAYLYQVLCEKQVRWPDGAERWQPKAGYCGRTIRNNGTVQ